MKLNVPYEFDAYATKKGTRSPRWYRVRKFAEADIPELSTRHDFDGTVTVQMHIDQNVARALEEKSFPVRDGMAFMPVMYAAPDGPREDRTNRLKASFVGRERGTHQKNLDDLDDALRQKSGIGLFPSPYYVPSANLSPDHVTAAIRQRHVAGDENLQNVQFSNEEAAIRLSKKAVANLAMIDDIPHTSRYDIVLKRMYGGDFWSPVPIDTVDRTSLNRPIETGHRVDDLIAIEKIDAYLGPMTTPVLSGDFHLLRARLEEADIHAFHTLASFCTTISNPTLDFAVDRRNPIIAFPDQIEAIVSKSRIALRSYDDSVNADPVQAGWDLRAAIKSIAQMVRETPDHVLGWQRRKIETAIEDLVQPVGRYEVFDQGFAARRDERNRLADLDDETLDALAPR